jgi:biotin carboxyl carrier protein
LARRGFEGEAESALPVAVGDEVQEGQAVVIVEAATAA